MVRNNIEIRISDIDFIETDFESSMFSSNIVILHQSNSNKTMKTCLDDCEMVKLAHTKLNKWAFNGSSLLIKPGDPAGPSVSYFASGKYGLGARMHGPIILMTIMLIVFSSLFMYYEKMYLLLALILVCFAFFGLERYKKVSVILYEKNMLVTDENGQQHCVAIADIKFLEKGHFCIKVTGADSRVFFFPRSFYFLPELIRHYNGMLVRC